MKKLIIYLCMLAGLVALLTACSGGGSSAPAPNSAGTATLTLSTSGTPSPAGNLSGIGLTVTLPVGVTVATNSDGSVATGVVIPSGLLSSGTATNNAVYNSSTRTLSLTIVSTQAAGFGVGQFATVVCSYSGAAPSSSGFSLSSFAPADLLLQPVSGLTAAYSAAIN